MYRFITGIVALGLAACAAYFSVIGIASLMGANFMEVAIMAGFLEAGKLICASAAYRFRNVAPGWVRSLLITFTVVMMLITSLGIFGFLSSSYQQAASERTISQQKVENLESKRSTFESEAERLQQDRQRLISEQQDIQETRAEQGWLSERQDERLSKIPAQLAETDSALTAARDSVLSLENRVTQLQSEQNADSKLGPIIFVANTVGLQENSAALYFILLLIFVFDPMAVTLVVALSMATDLEETATKDENEKQEVPETDDSEKQPEKEGDTFETADTNLGNVVKKKPIGKTINIEDVPVPNGPTEPQSADESGEQTGVDVSPEPKEDPVQKEDEDAESRNKPDEETVEQDTFYPEKPPELEVSKPPEEEETDDDFEEWLEGGKQQEREKPWKNAFKQPFN